MKGPRSIPPKVIGVPPQRRPKASTKPWYFRIAWLSPTLVCVAFAALIAGVAGLRQLVILVWDSSATSIEPEIETGVAPPAAATTLESATDELLESSEPELEILPPSAAQQPGRTLPRMLIVGRHPDMFQSLSEAMAAAIDGDVIEIRDDGPLYLEPGEAVWTGKRGTLTICGGKDYRPVLARSGPVPGVLLSFDAVGEGALVRLQNLTLVDVVSPGQMHDCSPVSTACHLEVQSCCFVCNTEWLLRLKRSVTDLRCANCYFHGNASSHLGHLRSGRLVLLNNLIVGVQHIVEIGDSDDPGSGTATYCYNTVAHCLDPFSIHWESAIESRNNLHSHLSGTWYIRAWATYLKHGGDYSNLIRYHGAGNLYHETTWEEFPGFQFSGFSGFQRLTRNGETDPVFADPLFVTPQSVLEAREQILPPQAFALRPDSPAHAAATDGTDIGCDLSRIPTPPPIVESLVAEMLQSVPPAAQQ